MVVGVGLGGRGLEAEDRAFRLENGRGREIAAGSGTLRERYRRTLGEARA